MPLTSLSLIKRKGTKTQRARPLRLINERLGKFFTEIAVGNMSDFIEVNWTSGSLDEARRIARYLVQERLAASAQIIPWIESIYNWNNQLETAQESKIVFISRMENYDKIKELIQKNCKYQVPEITYRYIDGGNKEYMDWIVQSTPTEFKTSHVS